MADEKSPFPDDHPIQEHWRNNKLKRTTKGLIQRAKEGDKASAKQILRVFWYQHVRELEDKGRFHLDPDFRGYLADAFNAILNGESADVALNLKPGRGKKGRPKRDSDELERAVRIGYRVAQLWDHETTFEKAKALAAQEFSVSEELAGAHYDTYMKSR